METRMLPPSGRDFDAYRLVRFEQKSTREAAAELGISQTLVRRLVDRVGDFLAEVVPAPADKNDEARRRRLNLAEQVAAEQVDFLQGEAVRKWRDSKGVQTTVRKCENAPAVTVVKETQGEPRYLIAAARLAIVGGKLPVSRLGSHVRYEDEEGEVEAQQEGHVEVAENPADEVCSVEAVSSEVTATESRAEEAAKPAVVEVCDSPTLPPAVPNVREAQCAQLPAAASNTAVQASGGPPANSRRERKLEKRKQKLQQNQKTRQAFLGQMLPMGYSPG